MMKKRNLKKALAAVLALTMCLSCGVTGFAADSEEREKVFSEGDKVELTVAANEGYVPDGVAIKDEG